MNDLVLLSRLRHPQTTRAIEYQHGYDRRLFLSRGKIQKGGPLLVVFGGILKLVRRGRKAARRAAAFYHDLCHAVYVHYPILPSFNVIQLKLFSHSLKFFPADVHCSFCVISISVAHAVGCPISLEKSVIGDRPTVFTREVDVRRRSLARLH